MRAAAGSGTHGVSPSTTFPELECQPGDFICPSYLNHSRAKANITHMFKILTLVSLFRQSSPLRLNSGFPRTCMLTLKCQQKDSKQNTTPTLFKCHVAFNNPKQAINLYFSRSHKNHTPFSRALSLPKLLEGQRDLKWTLGGGLVKVLINSRVISMSIIFPLHFKWKMKSSGLCSL